VRAGEGNAQPQKIGDAGVPDRENKVRVLADGDTSKRPRTVIGEVDPCRLLDGDFGSQGIAGQSNVEWILVFVVAGNVKVRRLRARIGGVEGDSESGAASGIDG